MARAHKEKEKEEKRKRDEDELEDMPRGALEEEPADEGELGRDHETET